MSGEEEPVWLTRQLRDSQPGGERKRELDQRVDDQLPTFDRLGATHHRVRRLGLDQDFRQEDSDLPEPAQTLQPALGEHKRGGAEHAGVNIDNVLPASCVHKHVDAEQTEETASVKSRRNRLRSSSH